MILASHGIIGSSIGQFDADAVAFFNRVTTAGGSLSTTEKTAVNTLVLQMKADGIWTKMKAIYPMVGASAAACSQNLKSSSFTGTFTATGWTFASTGVTPNGTSAYMSTGMNPSTNLSINSAHLSVYIRNTPNNGVLFSNGAFSCYLHPVSPLLYGGLSNTTTINNNASPVNSFLMINRPSSTTVNLFRANTKLTESTSNNGTSYTTTIIDLARYGSSFYSNGQFAFASIGDGLTDTEASDFYTAVQAFQTTLSRNI